MANQKVQIVLIRHGETENNTFLHDHLGKTKQLTPEEEAQTAAFHNANVDPKLTERGHSQAEQVSEFLDTYYDPNQTNRVIVSGLVRTHETAKHFCESKNLEQTIDPLFGEWTKESKRTAIEFGGINCMVDGTWDNFKDRTLECQQILQGLAGEVDKVFVFTHSVLISMLLSATVIAQTTGDISTNNFPCDYDHLTFHSENGSVSVIEYSELEGWKILKFNISEHLTKRSGQRV